MGTNLDNVFQWFPGMSQLPRDRATSFYDDNQEEHVDLLAAKVLGDSDQAMSDAKSLNMNELGLKAPSSRLSVLTVGNDMYRIEGMKDKGLLFNCKNDACAIADEFKKLGAVVKVVTDVREKRELCTEEINWAKTLNENSDDTAFFFWAGHELYHEGATHLLPTWREGSEMQLELLDPCEDTFKVHQIIKLFRVYSSCDLIVCLDSCRTVHVMRESKYWSANFSPESAQGKDALEVRNVDIWYSTQLNQVASDGSNHHSPFAESLLESLRLNVKGKRWVSLWNEVRLGTLHRTGNKQSPVQFGAGMGDKIIVPVDAVPQEEQKVSCSVYLPCFF